MIKIPYDIFYMSRMLKDKLVATKLEQLTKEKVQRMEEQVSGPFTNLYKLSYQHTHIIDSIYLGNAYNASNFTDLEQTNIGMIVNITEEIPNYYPDNFDYYNIHTLDDNKHHIKPYITPALEYIMKYQQEHPQKNILVHCFMGSSRSAGIVVAYYSLKFNKSIDESIAYVKDKRWIVNINTTFIQDLKEWREEVLSEPNF